MYLNYFGLSDNPFSIAPNPDYLYMSPRHKEALAHLTFGLRESGGFVMLTGEVGTGKTTVSRKLLAAAARQYTGCHDSKSDPVSAGAAGNGV